MSDVKIRQTLYMKTYMHSAYYENSHVFCAIFIAWKVFGKKKKGLRKVKHTFCAQYIFY